MHALTVCDNVAVSGYR